jgi:hypothetical protein
MEPGAGARTGCDSAANVLYSVAYETTGKRPTSCTKPLRTGSAAAWTGPCENSPSDPGMVVWTIDGHMFAAYTEAGTG